MSKQTEAERLAGHLEFPDGCPNEYIMRMQAAAELRRLVSFNQQLMDEVARLNKALADERETCAQVADGWSKRNDDAGAFIGKAIRARGSK